ncbi:hypothetical protein HNO52_01190 [Billgrantia diversa]|uniref:hypothetical protein n=1 Tax=Halomonas sp. MCCC 1A13316 TaxID=2733487 RepID=UPI0018A63083|nr:hypothetical protein [Halomonas sp. MCCC 1A13316]QOR37272.1 hypothetical protein HNO52_01190 [Halomonas sp. MCCC 1A13316]
MPRHDAFDHGQVEAGTDTAAAALIERICDKRISLGATSSVAKRELDPVMA